MDLTQISTSLYSPIFNEIPTYFDYQRNGN